MDKKFSAFLILLFILSVSLVYGIGTNDILEVYSFDLEHSYNDTLGNINGTPIGTTSIDSGTFICGDASSVYDGASGYVNFPSSIFRNNISGFYSVSCWINADTTGTRRYLSTGSSGNTYGVYYGLQSNVLVGGYHGVGQFSTGISLNTSTWYHVVVARNYSSSDQKNIIWLNGVRQSITNPTLNPIENTFSQNFLARQTGGSFTEGWDGYIDECIVFNYTVSEEDVSNIYNSGICVPYPFGGTINLISDLENIPNYNQESLDILYNITNSGGITNNTITCELDVNSILNQTSITNITSYNNTFNVIFGQIEANYNFSINCYNNEVSDATDTFQYFVDTISGTIQSSFVNNTEYTQLDTISIYTNYSDTNLFAYNLTFFDVNGDVWNNNNYFATNLTGGFAENLTSLILTEVGNFSIRTEIYDSHTSKIISNYNWTKFQNEFNNVTYKGIDFGRKFNLSSFQYANINDFSLIKNKDRYNMEFNFTDNIINQTFTLYLQTSGNLDYYGNIYGYEGHFIWNFKHWIDFNCVNINNLEIDYLSNNDVWRIRFTPTDNIVTCNSIGDLNYNSAIWYYQVSSVSASTDYSDILATISDSIEDGVRSMNMLWFWILFLFALGFPLILKSLQKKEDSNVEAASILSGVLFLICIILLLFFDFGLSQNLKWLLTTVCGILSLVYGVGFNEH